MMRDEDLRHKLEALLNECGVDTMLDLPDYIIASYVIDTLIAMRNMRSLLKAREEAEQEKGQDKSTGTTTEFFAKPVGGKEKGG